MLKLISFIKNFLGLNCIKIFCKWKQLDINTNKYLDVSQPSVSRYVNEVASALNDPQIFNGYIKFPNNFEDLNRLRQGYVINYHQNANFLSFKYMNYTVYVCCFSEHFAPLLLFCLSIY